MNRRFHLIIISGFILLAAASSHPSQLCAQGGESGMSFLKIGAGARSLGMGESGVALADRGYAMYYNPSAIGRDNRGAASIMHNEWVEDITTDFLGAVIAFDGWTLGVHMGLTQVSNIEVREVPGNPLGTFDSRNFAGGLTFALPLSDNLRVGITAKYLFEKIYSDVADGYAFDFGAHYEPFDGDLKPLVFGLAVANIGQMSPLHISSTTLPALARYGVGYSLQFESINSHLHFEGAGLTLFNEETTHFNGGAEFAYQGMLFGRLGYQSGYENKSYSVGFGAAYASVRFDYAYTPFREGFGAAHTVSLSSTF